MTLALAMLGVMSCSADDRAGEDESEDDVTSTTAVRPDGPAAEIVTELTGGQGANVASSAPPGPVLEAAGYEQVEYVAAGTASAYAADGELTGDGRWSLQPAGEARYRTRIVVRRPTDPADLSGTVLVEWLNVSGGLDADPDWQMLHEDITRSGDVWVGVSAQLIGVNGGPVRVTTPASEAAGAGQGIRNIDPERYGSLDHPGDEFSFDIFTQVARALRAGGAALGGAAPAHVLAVGESQSAFALVTYINGVQPLGGIFDGFLVHSRGAAGLPLAADGPADIAGSLSGTPTILRTDTTVPIVELQSETDVTGFFNSASVRQDDTDTFRLWEVAGTAHADTRLVGERADSLGCGAINDGPMHLAAKAAYRSLVTWVRTGEAPPTAPRLELVADAATPTLARDADGIVLGGIRTPPVDVPVDVLSGAPGPTATAIVCLLSGSTTPLPSEVLAARYADRAAYEAQFEASADDAVTGGFVLDADRDALLAYADPDRIG